MFCVPRQSAWNGPEIQIFDAKSKKIYILKKELSIKHCKHFRVPKQSAWNSPEIQIFDAKSKKKIHILKKELTVKHCEHCCFVCQSKAHGTAPLRVQIRKQFDGHCPDT